MSRCIIAGSGMTAFGRHESTSLKALGAQAAHAALADAGVGTAEIDTVVFANAMAGLMSGQECIRGQVVLQAMGLGGIAVINVENACASGSTALHQACALIGSGMAEVVLVLGAEKLYDSDKQRSFNALASAVDVEERDRILTELQREGGVDARPRSMFMDYYADLARRHMNSYGSTARDFAEIAAKNSRHGSHNDRAQFRSVLTADDVLGAPSIVGPLTRPMCSAIGDGAAAVVVMSEAKARAKGVSRPVRVAAIALQSGGGSDSASVSSRAAARAFATAGIGPGDLDVVECHDAAAPAELVLYEDLGLCAPGDGVRFLAAGATALGGRLPVNPSGGLLRRGHPVGATGLAQIVELTEQLRGRSGARQVENARVALAENGGGLIAGDSAALCVTILVA
jgi:acetyl-CoA acetyltransferase